MPLGQAQPLRLTGQRWCWVRSRRDTAELSPVPSGSSVPYPGSWCRVMGWGAGAQGPMSGVSPPDKRLAGHLFIPQNSSSAPFPRGGNRAPGWGWGEVCQCQSAFDWQLSCLEAVGHLGRMGQVACPIPVGLGSPQLHVSLLLCRRPDGPLPCPGLSVFGCASGAGCVCSLCCCVSVFCTVEMCVKAHVCLLPDPGCVPRPGSL